MSSKLNFVSVACNRIANCADWGRNNLYVYAASKFVAIYDPTKNMVVSTLKGHRARVNCVKFLPNLHNLSETEDKYSFIFNPEVEIVSGGVDCKVLIWHIAENGQQWKLKQELSGHTESVTSLAVCALPHSDETIIASSSSDNTVVIWARKGNESKYELKQVIKFCDKMQECVALCLLPDSDYPVLASGGVDSLVHLFVRRDEQGSFDKVVSLQGHQDWLRAMSFTSLDDGSVVLATASQDLKIRLWKFMQTDASHKMEGEDSNDNFTQHTSYSTNQGAHLLAFGHRAWSVVLDALLTGHEEWVYSVNWHPKLRNTTTGRITQPLCLLSASMDRTMMVWRPDAHSGGIWLSSVRVGEFGGLTGLFGQLGYFGGSFGPYGDAIIAHGYNGSFHLWKLNAETDSWEPKVTVSGHFNEVMDLSWDTNS